MARTAALLLAVACAPLNRARAPDSQSPGHRASTYDSESSHGDGLAVALSFSGGGTRAAALSYGVLQKLRDTEVRLKSGPRRLIDQIDVISSVSGGSFTAAFLALRGPEGLFAEFPQRFLFRNIQLELGLHLFLSPFGLFRIPSPYFDRIDHAAELYDSTVFDHKTFGDLVARRRKPFVVLNATTVAQGRSFEFTQEQFDLIGADLDSYPLAWAVAASSAFPFLLSPVTLKNYSQSKAPAHFFAEDDYLRNRDGYLRAVADRELMDRSLHPWVQLLDGGLADNTGLHYLLRDLTSLEGHLFQLIASEQIHRLLIVSVNANTAHSPAVDQRRRAPGLLPVLFATGGTAMDEATDDIIARVSDALIGKRNAILGKEPVNLPDDTVSGICFFDAPGRLQIFFVNVEFQALGQDAKDDLSRARDDELRRRLASLGTNFGLADEEVRELIAAGGRILDESACFRRFLHEVASSP